MIFIGNLIDSLSKERNGPKESARSPAGLRVCGEHARESASACPPVATLHGHILGLQGGWRNQSESDFVVGGCEAARRIGTSAVRRCLVLGLLFQPTAKADQDIFVISHESLV